MLGSSLALDCKIDQQRSSLGMRGIKKYYDLNFFIKERIGERYRKEGLCDTHSVLPFLFQDQVGANKWFIGWPPLEDRDPRSSSPGL